MREEGRENAAEERMQVVSKRFKERGSTREKAPPEERGIGKLKEKDEIAEE